MDGVVKLETLFGVGFVKTYVTDGSALACSSHR